MTISLDSWSSHLKREVNTRKLNITMPAVQIYYYSQMVNILTRLIIISIITHMKYRFGTWSRKDSFTYILKIHPHTHMLSLKCSPYTATRGGIKLQELQ